MEIIPLGDSALIVRLGEKFDPVRVQQTQRRLEQASLPGLIECAPAFNSLGLFFDSIKDFETLKAEIEGALKESAEANKPLRAAKRVEIPVCYEGEFAPDLEGVARHTRLSTDEIVRRHSSVQYRVHCIGFLPGFPYLGGLPPGLATPRRATPRTHVPAGAVAIGGSQTGIYPSNSPGGWNLIGRTAVNLFDVRRDPPALLQAGDRVRFRAIAREEFQSLPMHSREVQWRG